MKRIIIIVLTMLAGIPAWSQTQPSQKRLENQIMIGAGLFGETGNRARNVFPGAVLRLSYGLDVMSALLISMVTAPSTMPTVRRLVRVHLTGPLVVHSMLLGRASTS